MFTRPLRACSPLLLLALGAATASSATVEVTLEGLAPPTAVAPLGDGGIAVFTESGCGVFAAGRWTPLAGPSLQVDDAVAVSDAAIFVLGEAPGLYTIDVEAEAIRLEQATRVVAAGDSPRSFASLTADRRRVFAVGGGRLWRARRVGERLASLRPFAAEWGSQVAAATISARGYLAVLHRRPPAEEPSDEWSLSFCDPQTPTDRPFATFVTPLRSPLGIAYGTRRSPADHPLFALTERGVYRLDAGYPNSEPPACEATLVAEIRRPQAMAFGPEAALYIAALTDDDDGVLLRVRDLVPPATLPDD